MSQDSKCVKIVVSGAASYLNQVEGHHFVQKITYLPAPSSKRFSNDYDVQGKPFSTLMSELGQPSLYFLTISKKICQKKQNLTRTLKKVLGGKPLFCDLTNKSLLWNCGTKIWKKIILISKLGETIRPEPFKNRRDAKELVDSLSEFGELDRVQQVKVGTDQKLLTFALFSKLKPNNMGKPSTITKSLVIEEVSEEERYKLFFLSLDCKDQKNLNFNYQSDWESSFDALCFEARLYSKGKRVEPFGDMGCKFKEKANRTILKDILLKGVEENHKVDNVIFHSMEFEDDNAEKFEMKLKRKHIKFELEQWVC